MYIPGYMPPCVCSRVYPGVCLPVCVVGYTRVYIPLRTMGGMLGIYTSQDHGRHAGYVTHYGCPVSELPRAQKHAPRHPFHCWRAGQPPYYSRFTVGEQASLPTIHPFHCWWIPLAPYYSPVSLLVLYSQQEERGRGILVGREGSWAWWERRDTPYIHPGTTGGHTTPHILGILRSLGPPSMPTSWLMSRSLRCDELRCWQRGHQAQEGDLPWVRASARLKALFPVEVCRSFCAELLRSSR